MTKTQDLPAIRNQLYERAEKWWRSSFWLGVVLQVSALVSILTGNDTSVAVAAGLALFVPIAVVWLRYSAANISRKADKCRRLILYADGLGQEIQADELAIVRGWAENTSDAPFTPPYYSSTVEPGARRLLDITAEASFFTHRLAEVAARRKLLVFVVSALLTLGILYVSIETVSSDVVVVVARAALTTIAFLVSGDLLLLWRQYSELAASSERSFRECARLRDLPGVSNRQAHQVVEDYHLALAQSPPIPRRLYQKQVQRLNDIYRQSHGVQEGNG